MSKRLTCLWQTRAALIYSVLIVLRFTFVLRIERHTRNTDADLLASEDKICICLGEFTRHLRSELAEQLAFFFIGKLVRFPDAALLRFAIALFLLS